MSTTPMRESGGITGAKLVSGRFGARFPRAFDLMEIVVVGHAACTCERAGRYGPAI
jgi:hypothetical protein